MSFIPGLVPPKEISKDPLWFLFRADRLLVDTRNSTAQLLCTADPGKIGLEPSKSLYLGLYDGHPCYTAVVGDGTEPPEGLSFLGLRVLFGLLEEETFKLAVLAIQIANWDSDYRFCGRCGSPTVNKSEQRAKLCSACGFLVFPRISPAVIVAVVKDHRILLAHAHRFSDGMYSVIAGFVEPGETLEDCVHREVLEEVGIEVKNIRYFGSQSWPFPHSLMIGFTAEYAAGEITVDEEENSDAGWYSAESLPRIPDKISIARRLIDWFVEDQGREERT
jgi:NAD+ diphosphatase